MLSLVDPFLSALARFAVAHGLLFPDFAERFKAHYVDAAQRAAGDKATDSRVSVLTGLQRRDIARIKALDGTAERPNHLSRLVALWRTRSPYSGDGQPVMLPKNGPEPSFETLARLVRKDVHPRTMLDTLVQAGTVEIREPDQGADQQVHLIQMSYQPVSGSEDQIAYLAANLGDHLEAATDNVLGQLPKHFERAVHYGDLTEAQLETLKAKHAALQMKVLEDLSDAAAALKNDNTQRGPHRFRAGGYFYHTKDPK
ncbi:DUF6502 family protein [Algirhabdus cladophorae]|uniref:DUF6502 family protein n=1 Tax=Algirhabdus cladophorae TaxID=3377108 RepID=UPI003B849A08